MKTIRNNVFETNSSSEWNDIKGENVARRLSRYLQFFIPDYTYEHLLENMAVKHINHNTIYVVSWEKEY